MILLVLVAASAYAAWRWVPWWQIRAQQQYAARQLAAYDQALDTRVELGKLSEGTCELGELVQQLQPQVGIPMSIDRQALSSLWHDGSIRVRTGPTGVMLHDVLTEALGSVELAYCRRDGTLVFTTPAIAEKASQQRTLRQYVLPSAAGDGTPIDGATDEWYSVIMQAVGDRGWDSDRDHIEISARVLTACLCDESHRRVRQLLRQFAQHPADRAESPGAWSPAERRIMAALDQTASVDWAEKPLAELIPFLAQHGIAAKLEGRFLADAGVSPQAPVTLKLDNVSLRTILREALGQHQINWVIRRDRLAITSPDDAESEELLVAYNVRDLVETAPYGTDFDSLIDLITTTVEPDSWHEVIGPGPIHELSPGWLVIPQTREIHEQIANLLALLRRAKIVGSARSWERTSAGRKIQEALATEVKLEYYGETLQEVCDDLAHKMGINVVLDLPVLLGTIVSPQTPVECVLPPLPLADGLLLLADGLQPQRRWLGKPRGVPFFYPPLPFPPADLGYLVEDDVLKLTTNEAAAARFEVAVFNLEALAGEREGAEWVADLVRDLIARSSWNGQNDPGACLSLGSLLVVSNDRRLLRQVERFIESLKEALLDPPHGGDARVSRPVWSEWGPREEVVWRKLQSIASFEPRSVGLLDEIRRLCRQFEIPLVVEEQALRDAKADLSAMVTTFQAQESIQDRLLTLIHGQPMSLAIRRGALVVSSDDRYAEAAALRLYWIGDVAKDAGEVPALVEKLDAQGVLSSWSKCLGDFDPSRWDWLLVSTPREGHERMEAQLAKLRGGQTPSRPNPKSIMLQRHRRFLDALRVVEESPVDFPQDVFIGYPPFPPLK